MLKGCNYIEIEGIPLRWQLLELKQKQSQKGFSTSLHYCWRYKIKKKIITASRFYFKCTKALCFHYAKTWRRSRSRCLRHYKSNSCDRVWEHHTVSYFVFIDFPSVWSIERYGISCILCEDYGIYCLNCVGIMFLNKSNGNEKTLLALAMG